MKHREDDDHQEEILRHSSDATKNSMYLQRLRNKKCDFQHACSNIRGAAGIFASSGYAAHVTTFFSVLHMFSYKVAWQDMKLLMKEEIQAEFCNIQIKHVGKMCFGQSPDCI